MAESANRGDREEVRFIVNADDLGVSDAVNAAIFSGIADGLISSATLMANGPAVDAAIERAKDYPAASFGVHLNITEHRPLTESPRLRPLLDPTGAFRPGAVYEVRWTRALVRSVVAEWTAQVFRVQRAGLPVSHLDSHQHVHTIPGLFFALKRVQRATGIRRVRGTWSIYDREHTPSVWLRSGKRLWWWGLRSFYPTRTVSEFSSLLMFQRAVAEGTYRPRRWPSHLELMVHPGLRWEDSDLEAAALKGQWMAALPVHGELVSYRDL